MRTPTPSAVAFATLIETAILKLSPPDSPTAAQIYMAGSADTRRAIVDLLRALENSSGTTPESPSK